MRVPVLNMNGDAVDEMELRDDVFGIEPNVPVMHQALIRQVANARLGTHQTKTRADVSGGGRKPWRQKGTGRARQGSTRAPQWKGGGTVFGPHPRSYAQKMNRKMRRLALRSALSTKAAEDHLLVIDDLEMGEPKTTEMVSFLQRIRVDASALVLLPAANTNVELSGRNLDHVKTLRANCLNVRDLLTYNYVIMPRDSVEMIHSMLGPAE